MGVTSALFNEMMKTIATVVERELQASLLPFCFYLPKLLASHHGEPGSIPGRVTPDFCKRESCRTMPLFGGFSRGSPVSPALCDPALLHTQLVSPPSALKTSIFVGMPVSGSNVLTFQSDETVAVGLFCRYRRGKGATCLLCAHSGCMTARGRGGRRDDDNSQSRGEAHCLHVIRQDNVLLIASKPVSGSPALTARDYTSADSVVMFQTTQLSKGHKLMWVIEESIEQRRNEGAGERGDPREDPRPTVTRPGIEPGLPWWELSDWLAGSIPALLLARELSIGLDRSSQGKQVMYTKIVVTYQDGGRLPRWWSSVMYKQMTNEKSQDGGMSNGEWSGCEVVNRLLEMERIAKMTDGGVTRWRLLGSGSIPETVAPKSSKSYFSCHWIRIPSGCVRLCKLALSSPTRWATVAERLASSPPTKAGSLQIFACGNRAGRCRWSAALLGDLAFPPLHHSSATPYSPQLP
ncbi:hypothetical protein PR048_006508 [Dryococelus australis]|uniref:Uncharacterized protein n=1 Tax=Dryococelus australis TaxID=614101 RepID=A0ABQ9IB76_9NEOP|nr:hypothetical protein PR048_006508 [Dryococelus australis]